MVKVYDPSGSLTKKKLSGLRQNPESGHGRPAGQSGTVREETDGNDQVKKQAERRLEWERHWRKGQPETARDHQRGRDNQKSPPEPGRLEVSRSSVFSDSNGTALGPKET